MKHRVLPSIAVVTALVALVGCSATEDDTEKSQAGSTTAMADVGDVAPALDAYHKKDVLRLWQRPGLSDRDRSLVTVAHMIAGGHTAELPFYVDKAIGDGVRPREISEAVTHLAFYSGWQNARAAIPGIRSVFDERGVKKSELPAVQPDLLPLDQEAEKTRDDDVRSDFDAVSPGVVESTRDVVFRDLWLRPDLRPRDRSLVTVVSLITNGQSEQLTYHLGRAMDNGLTSAQAGEMLNQLAFYAGWPRVFSALPVAKDVLNSRA
ncbi:carboxymuconolactone decarboxylase family protein [Streptomyces sp. JV176]|uniref:carboxymuconolactone decarboxylase family protein n=1 Tax=Streptomyces sp. JV176 TaxID=858630 RepID=UPI002E77BF33|nr:carboxymuconolactone decarboxylase family protein [Streptomyces sp. JV176]MEE1804048.1 carboxymuconolactone decarboxylase family protein [Streptomyces sp. JV176]